MNSFSSPGVEAGYAVALDLYRDSRANFPHETVDAKFNNDKPATPDGLSGGLHERDLAAIEAL